MYEGIRAIEGDGAPYAYQTRVGWCTVGPIINIVGKESIGCSQVPVIDATSSYIYISSHHFFMEKAMKKVSLQVMFQTMCQNDFNETSTIKLNIRIMKDAEEVLS